MRRQLISLQRQTIGGLLELEAAIENEGNKIVWLSIRYAEHIDIYREQEAAALIALLRDLGIELRQLERSPTERKSRSLVEGGGEYGTHGNT
jgi:hypothetical protein